MQTFGYAHVNRHVGNLYLAIIEALQDILGWYKRAGYSEWSYPKRSRESLLIEH